MSYVPELSITAEMLEGLNAFVDAGCRVSLFEGYIDGEREEIGVTIRMSLPNEGIATGVVRYGAIHVRQWVDKETFKEFWVDGNGETTVDAILRDIKSLVSVAVTTSDHNQQRITT